MYSFSMKNTLTAASLAAFAMAALVTVPGANAQGNFHNQHPRRWEVLHRDGQLRKQIAYDRGHLDGRYNQLRREDNVIARQERRDARMNGGYITPGEQRHLNYEENRLQNQVNRDSSMAGGYRGGWNRFDRRHPRRGEVLNRDAGLNSELHADRGHLSGQFGRLESEDHAIRRQEQADARLNGGYITRGEQQHFNREENHLQRQIDRDNR